MTREERQKKISELKETIDSCQKEINEIESEQRKDDQSIETLSETDCKNLIGNVYDLNAGIPCLDPIYACIKSYADGHFTYTTNILNDKPLTVPKEYIETIIHNNVQVYVSNKEINGKVSYIGKRQNDLDALQEDLRTAFKNKMLGDAKINHDSNDAVIKKYVDCIKMLKDINAEIEKITDAINAGKSMLEICELKDLTE